MEWTDRFVLAREMKGYTSSRSAVLLMTHLQMPMLLTPRLDHSNVPIMRVFPDSFGFFCRSVF